MILILVLQVQERLAGLAQNLFLPAQELLAEIFPLPLVHERLVLGRTILRSCLSCT